jgi:hypothetical protein
MRDEFKAAFPGQRETRFGEPNDCNEGMSLRDYFAAKAMQGYIASYARTEYPAPMPKSVALQAYAYADAMLAQRTKE